MKEIIDKLKNNFLFQASLGSKELFHSNMLAWILEQKNKDGEFEALKIFIKRISGIEVGEIYDGEFSNFRIERESLNIDLTIKWMEDKSLNNDNKDYWNTIFIENKMKSIPTEEQLNEYDKKIKKFLNGTTTLFKGKPKQAKLERKLVDKFLLTPFPSDVNSDSNDWKNITYVEHILKFLKDLKSNHIQFIEEKDIKYKYVIQEYIDFIENQNKVLDKFNLGVDISSLRNRNYDFYKLEIYSSLKDLRLHDLVLKLAYQKISLLIEEQLSTDFENLIEHVYKNFKDGTKKIFIDHSFSKGTGISTVSVLIKNKQAVSLQLQGNSLRYFASLQEGIGAKNIDFAQKLVEEELWFYDLNGELLSGKGWKNKDVLKINDSTAFNSYGLNFIYLNKNVSEYSDRPISALVDLICGEVKRVIDNFDEFEKLIP
jgi:hypothetical protein